MLTHLVIQCLVVFIVKNLYSGRKIRKHPPQIATFSYLVPLEREFCVDYDKKKFTAIAVSEDPQTG